MIPGLNDAEMEQILRQAAAAGAGYAGYVLLRLPHELREMFDAWLHTHYPQRAAHVLSLIRQTRDGALNDAGFHRRFRGTGAYAELLSQRFHRAARQCGLEGHLALDHGAFAVPAAADLGQAQLSLL